MVWVVFGPRLKNLAKKTPNPILVGFGLLWAFYGYPPGPAFSQTPPPRTLHPLGNQKCHLNSSPRDPNFHPYVRPTGANFGEPIPSLYPIRKNTCPPSRIQQKLSGFGGLRVTMHPRPPPLETRRHGNPPTRFHCRNPLGTECQPISRFCEFSPVKKTHKFRTLPAEFSNNCP